MTVDAKIPEGEQMAISEKWLWTLLVIAVAPGLLWSQVKTDSSAVVGRTFTIEDCVNHFNKDKIVKTSVGYQYWFVDRNFIDGRTLKLSVVAPHGATHEPHRHVEDEFFFVLEGKAEFFLDGARAVGEPYTSFYCPPHHLHGIRNAGEVDLKYLVIKKYEAESK
jgi:mannose-6-phosphate isomerase-like protein (cupin superfamily)